MVAKIKSGKSLKGALRYNERKVSEGRAALLEASGYLKDITKLTFNDKLFRLQDLAGRNQRVRTNTVHVSLNFAVGEQPNTQTLKLIAEQYMQGIGFAGQPYLVYQHFDAGHPHIHIVSTNIDRDGKRISLHNLGKTKSEAARKAIEREFGLQKAEQAKASATLAIEPIRYGSVESKRAMELTVLAVTDQYRFTSLPEFNALLQQFNLLADRGSQTSVMNKHKGLRYWITENGKKMGVPIKASSLKGKPTMRLLEQRFVLNKALRRPDQDRLCQKVAAALERSRTAKEFQSALTKVRVHTVIQRTSQGLIYGFTFVDNESKAVFKGSDLGKGYAAAAIAAKLDGQAAGSGRPVQQETAARSIISETPAGQGNILDALLAPVPDDPALPAALRQKKKKKRRLNL